MKLIIKQYLASLKERDELEVILPDLLSEMGLNVFSRPGRGTCQDGVDVAAVGSLNGNEEKVYLFSIKAGDLTRKDWDGDEIQSLRPSLNEILDSYIPNRLPDEHKGKNIIICLCFGGDIKEQVRLKVEGYIKQNKKDQISFEEWNGDKLASLILSNFLQEDLLPPNAQSQLRKALALLDEPEASYRHFSLLLKSLTDLDTKEDKVRLTIIRQITICLWILFAWSRDADNLEAAYLASEISLLYTWNIAKESYYKKLKISDEIQKTFLSVLNLYFQVSSEFIETRILPFVSKRHALSIAIHPSCSLDVNLKLFDILGRLALQGIWRHWWLNNIPGQAESQVDEMKNTIINISISLKQLITSNPALCSPVKDDQVIDISLAFLLLMIDTNNSRDVQTWLWEILDRSAFSYRSNGQYPCNLGSYSDLLEHPQRGDYEYFCEVTGGSVLFPMIALVAALLGQEDTYKKVQDVKEKYLSHCDFQLWYPDETSEEHIYLNSDLHGGVLSDVRIDRPMDEFLKQIFGECKHSPDVNCLSAWEKGLWPLIIVACRHYRLPVPEHLWQGLYESQEED